MNDMAEHDMSASSRAPGLDFDTPALKRKRRMRALKDRLARWYVSIGGLAVLGAITLIFFYLAHVVLPIFQGAELGAAQEQRPAWLAERQPALLLAIEEQNQVAMRLDASGQVQFLDVRDGALLSEARLALPEGARIVALGEDTPGSRRFVVGLSDGRALVAEHEYRLSYPDGVKTITPELVYPFGAEPIVLDAQGRALETLAISVNGSSLMLAGVAGGELQTLRLEREENLFTGDVSLSEQRYSLPALGEPIGALQLEPRQQWLYAFGERAEVQVFDLR